MKPHERLALLFIVGLFAVLLSILVAYTLVLISTIPYDKGFLAFIMTVTIVGLVLAFIASLLALILEARVVRMN